ncbi:MAG: YhfC family glutamic-type intramembrane protease, partial [Dehalococcoidia bacterium]
MVTIVAGAARLLIEFAESTFNLSIHPLARIFIAVFPVVIASFIVTEKLTKRNKEGEKNHMKISPLFFITGIGMVGVAVASALWIISLGADWSVLLLGALAWIISVALKIAWAVLTHKPILNFLKTKLPTKLSGPISWSYIGLLTGIFECGIALVFVLKLPILYQANWVYTLAFGVGFGAIEALVLGLLSLVRIGYYTIRPKSIPEKEREGLKITPDSLRTIPLGIVERVSALLIHIFTKAAIILAVQQSIYLLFWFSFGFKSLVDGIAGWMHLEKDIRSVTKASQM